jgi:hypothetical protein
LRGLGELKMTERRSWTFIVFEFPKIGAFMFPIYIS